MNIRFVFATIAVAGASTGPVIASLIQAPIQMRDICYVLMADWYGVPARGCRPRVAGKVLSNWEAPWRLLPTTALAAI